MLSNRLQGMLICALAATEESAEPKAEGAAYGAGAELGLAAGLRPTDEERSERDERQTNQKKSKLRAYGPWPSLIGTDNDKLNLLDRDGEVQPLGWDVTSPGYATHDHADNDTLLVKE